MKFVGVFFILNLMLMLSCVGKSATDPASPGYKATEKPIDWMPYLTLREGYVYVDRKLNRQIEEGFTYAEPFLPTGYAIVGDKEHRNAVIDSEGNLTQDYTEDDIELSQAGGLTLIKVVREYEKKMPIWKWEWMFMAKGIKKEQTYHQVEIRVLETNQVIVSADVPYYEDSFSLNHNLLDQNHLILDDVLYEIKNSKLKKLKSGIPYSLSGGRYIAHSNDKFSIYRAGVKQALFPNLSGITEITVVVNGQQLVMDSINLDRYGYVTVPPKLLHDSKNDKIYVFPQYDKALPKEIDNATEEQVRFMKDVSMVYAIPNSPYFILGRFNYDHDIWAYDWLYVDEEGNLYDEIEAVDFYILDQVGYLIWPDKYLIFNDTELQAKIGRRGIQIISQSDDLYIVKTQSDNGGEKQGLWNAASQNWEIKPDYHAVKALDGEAQIFAIRKDGDGDYYLHNNRTKTRLGKNTYKDVYASGLAYIVDYTNGDKHFYIDILTGKEYRD